MSYSNPAAYQRFMGRWSAHLAPSFIRFAGVEDAPRVLDVGCGTGSLSAALLLAGPAIQVIGVDPVPAYVAFARQVSARRSTWLLTGDFGTGRRGWRNASQQALRRQTAVVTSYHRGFLPSLPLPSPTLRLCARCRSTSSCRPPTSPVPGRWCA